MSRIFFALAMFAFALVIVSLILGLRIGDLAGVARQVLSAQKQLREAATEQGAERLEQQRLSLNRHQPTLRRASLHRLFGIAAGMTTLLVNSVALTYFIGTARWCREVADRYRLDPALAARSDKIKRAAFPWIMAGILSTIVIVALGAASDPGAVPRGSGRWVTPHLISALLGAAVIGWSFLVQVARIDDNHRVIEAVLGEVARIRAERGLDEPSQSGDLASNRVD